MSEMISKDDVAKSLQSRIGLIKSNIETNETIYTNPTERIREVEQVITWLYIDEVITKDNFNLLMDAIKGAYSLVAHRTE